MAYFRGMEVSGKRGVKKKITMAEKDSANVDFFLLLLFYYFVIWYQGTYPRIKKKTKMVKKNIKRTVQMRDEKKKNIPTDVVIVLLFFSHTHPTDTQTDRYCLLFPPLRIQNVLVALYAFEDCT